MMASLSVSREEVVERSAELPSFPRIVSEILATLDDPEANLKVLVDHIGHDPAITARVLSSANIAASKTRRLSPVQDVFTATSLIGVGRVREMAVINCIGKMVESMFPPGGITSFWQHSVATGVCSQEIALQIQAAVSADAALVCGLLHDIGQLWLHRFRAEAVRETWGYALSHAKGIEEVERDRFGIDHTGIGAWLAEHWRLPPDICNGIRHHHAPDAALGEPLVPLLHVAEVLSNALDLAAREENRVTTLSAAACARLGLAWDEKIRALFGRIESRAGYATDIFRK